VDLGLAVDDVVVVMDGLGKHRLVISSGDITVVEGIDGECSTLRGGVNNHDEAAAAAGK
jgi:hypothetical protein